MKKIILLIAIVALTSCGVRELAKPPYVVVGVKQIPGQGKQIFVHSGKYSTYANYFSFNSYENFNVSDTLTFIKTNK